MTLGWAGGGAEHQVTWLHCSTRPSSAKRPASCSPAADQGTDCRNPGKEGGERERERDRGGTTGAWL